MKKYFNKIFDWYVQPMQTTVGIEYTKLFTLILILIDSLRRIYGF